MSKAIKASLALLVPCSLVLAYMALKINSGAVELHRWSPLILSNMTAMYFILLMITGGSGGYIASKQKTKRRRLAVNMLTFAVIGILIYVLGGFIPFVGWVR